MKKTKVNDLDGLTMIDIVVDQLFNGEVIAIIKKPRARTSCFAKVTKAKIANTLYYSIWMVDEEGQYRLLNFTTELGSVEVAWAQVNFMHIMKTFRLNLA